MQTTDAITAAKHFAEQSQLARQESASRRARLVEMARVCQQLERWDEMIENVSQFKNFTSATAAGAANGAGDADSPLTAEERALLQTAYKAKVGKGLKSLQTLRSLAHNAAQQGNALTEECAAEYCALLEQDVGKLCTEVIAAVEGTLLPREPERAAQIFYHKLLGPFGPGHPAGAWIPALSISCARASLHV